MRIKTREDTTYLKAIDTVDLKKFKPTEKAVFLLLITHKLGEKAAGELNFPFKNSENILS